MTVPIHQVHNVLRTYERAFKPIPSTPLAAPPTSFQGPDRVSISLEALSKLGETTSDRHVA